MKSTQQGRGMARDTRKQQILIHMHAKRFGALVAWLSADEIAKALGLKKTAHLFGILHELQNEGFIHMKSVPWRKNASKYYFMIDASTPYSSRHHYTFACMFNAPEQSAFVPYNPSLVSNTI